MKDQREDRYLLDATEDLTPFERAQIKRLLPQIEDMLETRRRQKWLFKMAGMFLLGLPAVAAVWQAVIRTIEWIRSQ